MLRTAVLTFFLVLAGNAPSFFALWESVARISPESDSSTASPGCVTGEPCSDAGGGWDPWG
jgi:hypothetical protein